MLLHRFWPTAAKEILLEGCPHTGGGAEMCNRTSSQKCVWTPGGTIIVMALESMVTIPLKKTGSEWDLFVFKPHRGEFISKGVWDHFISCKIKSGIDEMSYYNSYAGHLWLEQLSWFMFMLYAKFIITYDQDISRLYTITRTVSHYLLGPPFGGWGARKNIRSSGWLVLHTANIRAEAWLGPALLTAWEFGAIRLLSLDCNLRSGGCIAFLHIIYIYTVTYI